MNYCYIQVACDLCLCLNSQRRKWYKTFKSQVSGDVHSCVSNWGGNWKMNTACLKMPLPQRLLVANKTKNYETEGKWVYHVNSQLTSPRQPVESDEKCITSPLNSIRSNSSSKNSTKLLSKLLESTMITMEQLCIPHIYLLHFSGVMHIHVGSQILKTRSTNQHHNSNTVFYLV